MQKLTLMAVLVAAHCCSLFAQVLPPNGITTNPAAPVNTQLPRKKNTFDYTAERFSLNTSPTISADNSIPSPFYTTDNSNISHFYDPIPALGLRDVLPQDGWELIKRDFGYQDNGAPNLSAVTTPYLVLYNKYTSTLRVFVARGEDRSYNGANIRVRFSNLASKTSLLDQGDALKSLSDFTGPVLLNSSTEFYNRPLKWFYADFPMTYDPCTCLFESNLSVDVSFSSTSTVTLDGNTNGRLVSEGRPQEAAQQGANTLSFGDIAAGAKKVGEAYKSGSELIKGLKGKVDALASTSANRNPYVNGYPFDGKPAEVQAKKSAQDNLAGIISKSNFLRTGLGAIPYVSTALSILDMFTSGGRQAPAPQEVMVQPMSISMTSKFTGAISTIDPYTPVSFRTPGSKYTGYADSEYPYYNEILGVFNLLKKPQLLIRNYSFYTGYKYVNGYSVPTYTRQTLFKLAEDVQYVINPASGLEVQDIKATILGYSLYDLNGRVNGGSIELAGTNAGVDEYQLNDLRNLYCMSRTAFASLSRPIPSLGSVENFSTQMRIKFFVNLRRKDADANTQNVLVVATYPVTVTRTDVQSYPNDGWIPTTSCDNGIALAPIVDATTLSTFCNSTAYKANRNFARYAANVADIAKGEWEKEAAEKLASTQLFSLYPNPIRNRVVLQYTVERPGNVKITLHNLAGQQVETLFDAYQEADLQKMVMDIAKHPSGLYFITIETNTYRITQKAVIIP